MGAHRKFSDSEMHGALTVTGFDNDRAAGLLGCNVRTVQRYRRRRARVLRAEAVAQRMELVKRLRNPRHTAAPPTDQED